jgi:hypothetical protein
MSLFGGLDLGSLKDRLKEKGELLVQESMALADKLSLDRLQEGDSQASPQPPRDAVDYTVSAIKESVYHPPFMPCGWGGGWGKSPGQGTEKIVVGASRNHSHEAY